MHTSVRLDAIRKHEFPDDGGRQLFHFEHHVLSKGSVFYHYHSQFELSLVESEGGTRIIGDDETPIATRDLVLIGPNLPHRWEFADAAGYPRPAELWVLAFSRRSLGVELLDCEDMEGLRNLLAGADRGIAFSKKTAARLHPLFCGLADRGGLGRIRDFLAIVEALGEDGGARPIVSAGYHGSGRDADYRLIVDIVERFGPGGEEPRVAEAAAFAGMSVSTFARFFKRTTGKPFLSYLNGLRIHRACALLSRTDRSIVDVAFEVGFANLSNFNRRFKRETGMTPRSFRRAKRKPEGG